MLLEIGLVKRKKTSKKQTNKEKTKKQKQKQKPKKKNKTEAPKKHKSLSLGYPSSYFYNKRCNMYNNNNNKHKKFFIKIF